MYETDFWTLKGYLYVKSAKTIELTIFRAEEKAYIWVFGDLFIQNLSSKTLKLKSQKLKCRVFLGLSE